MIKHQDSVWLSVRWTWGRTVPDICPAVGLRETPFLDSLLWMNGSFWQHHFICLFCSFIIFTLTWRCLQVSFSAAQWYFGFITLVNVSYFFFTLFFPTFDVGFIFKVEHWLCAQHQAWITVATVTGQRELLFPLVWNQVVKFLKKIYEAKNGTNKCLKD